ncbi:MAG: hypothetical protein J5793_02555, partial [Clostridia bacterium]|nr:hypothetical protein [Clostridia bacterium]
MKIARKLVSVLLVIAVLSALPLALSAAALRDMGDVNGADGVTAVDYLMIKRHVLKSFEIDDMWGYLSADINHDGEINAVDYLMVKRAVLNSFTIDEYVDDPSHCFLNENNNTFDVDKDL